MNKEVKNRAKNVVAPGNGAEHSSCEVMVVAGESSSDLHAAGVVRALKDSSPEIVVFGMGGDSLREAGAEVVIDSREVASVMGLIEVLGKLPKLYRAYRRLVTIAKERRPQVVLLVDFPDFNFIVGKALHRLGIKVVYFVCPQVWAWRRGRVRQMKKFVDCAAVIFPFEEEFFFRRGIKAHFVGHPFVDLQVAGSRLAQASLFDERPDLDPQRPVLALLPGSRHGEVGRLLEPMIEGFLRVEKVRPGLQAVIPVADTLDEDSLREQIPAGANVTLFRGEARKVLEVAQVAVVASGTATVEAALAGIPFFVVYKMAPLTMFVARTLVRGVKYFAMPNLIAGKKIVQEFLQQEVTAENIAREIEKILGDPALQGKIKKDLGTVRQALTVRVKGPSKGVDTLSECPTAYQRVAELIREIAGYSLKSESSALSKKKIVGS